MTHSVNDITNKLSELQCPSEEKKEDNNEDDLKVKVHADKLYEEGIKGVKVEELEDEKSSKPPSAQNPFISATTFDQLNLKPELLRGIAQKKFEKPSKIQAQALPIILSKNVNLIAQAQSGSGKTAAFTLGILNNIDLNQNYPQAIIVSPTRELTRQTEEVLKDLGQYLSNLKILLAIPGQETTIPISAQVIIGTPGRIKDILTQKKYKVNVSNIKMIVLDEADDLLSSTGNDSHMSAILRAIQAPGVKIQKLLFSATWPLKVLAWSKDKLLKNRSERSAILTLTVEQLSVSTISQFYIRCPSQASKSDILDKLFIFLEVGQAIIFVRSRVVAQQLYEQMKSKGDTLSIICGDMDPKVRDKHIDSFRQGATRNLISTDLLSRGIDILEVNVVINFDLPNDPETYLHRIGRTGRYGKQGVAINLVHDDLSEKLILDFSQFYKKEITKITEDEIASSLKEKVESTLISYGLEKRKD